MAEKPRRTRRTTSTKVDQNAPAYRVIEKFGRLIAFCEHMDLAPSTVHGWLVAGLIPAKYQARIRAKAAELDIALDPAEFVPEAMAA